MNSPKEPDNTVFDKHPNITLLVCLFVLLLITEVTLRLLYKNPYQLDADAKYASIVEPSMSGVFNSANLYEGGKKCVIKINEKFEIESGKETDSKLPNAHFLGGSTTESAFVPKGKRWPDLIDGFNTHNHGTSGKNIMHSYYNLQFLLDKDIVKTGDTIFVLNAVNDLRKILKRYKYKKESLHYIPFNTVNYTVMNDVNYFFNNIYLVALIKQSIKYLKHSKTKIKSNTDNNQVREVGAEELRQKLIVATSTGKRQKILNEKEFEYVYKNLDEQLRQREHILNLLSKKCSQNNLRLILLTQPNSYTDNYIVRNGVYELPVVNAKNTTRQQARKLLDRVNRQTIDFAKENKIEYIDVDSKFKKHDPNPLFYDSVHYTIKGSKLFADIINETLKK